MHVVRNELVIWCFMGEKGSRACPREEGNAGNERNESLRRERERGMSDMREENLAARSGKKGMYRGKKGEISERKYCIVRLWDYE